MDDLSKAVPRTPAPRRVLALIPAHNEAGRVAPVITRTSPLLPVLVVDDGSSDETARVAQESGAAVLSHPVNQGKGAALRSGFRWAAEQGFEAVLTLDADGQHDPAEIPAFLASYAATGADLVIGAREFRRMPAVRRLSNTLGRLVFSGAVGRSIRDNQSGYRLLSRRLMDAIIRSTEDGFAFEVEMIAVCIGRGYRLSWVPISTIYGDQTSHIRPVDHVRSFLVVSRRAHEIVKRGGRI